MMNEISGWATVLSAVNSVAILIRLERICNALEKKKNTQSK